MTVDRPTNAIPLLNVAIIGAGSMGAGIAVTCARAGIKVRCLVRSEESRTKLFGKIGLALDVLAAAVLADPQENDTVIASISAYSTIAEAVRGCDLIVESVSESIPLKLEVLAEISAHCGDDAIITTNTSSLDLAQLEAGVLIPARFAGLHWFYPAELVEIVEVVASPSTSEAVLQKLGSFAAHIGKRVVNVRRPVPGFVVNRLQYALLREAHHLIAEGVCDAEDIDTSLVACLGPRWSATGPLESMDLAGLDVHSAVARQLYPQLSNAKDVHQRLADLVARGDLGAKSGKGIRGAYDSKSVAQLFTRRANVVQALRVLKEAGNVPTANQD